MKISNSKKQLAKIIHENGGWRDGYGFSAQDGDDCAVWFYDNAPVRSSGAWWVTSGSGLGHCGIEDVAKLPNWHQTILSRDEYFHLHPAQDADGWIEWKGWECPVVEGDRIDVKFSDGDEFFDVSSDCGWGVDAGGCNIIAYRLHKPEQSKPEFCESVMWSIPGLGINSKNININITQVDDINVVESKPTIEQLAADYRNASDYADRKQQEADAAKADVETKLTELVAAGKAIGLVLSIAGVEPELVITVQVGDEVECVKSNVEPSKHKGMIGTVLEVDDSSTPYLVNFEGEDRIWCHEVKFIRRP